MFSDVPSISRGCGNPSPSSPTYKQGKCGDISRSKDQNFLLSDVTRSICMTEDSTIYAMTSLMGVGLVGAISLCLEVEV